MASFLVKSFAIAEDDRRRAVSLLGVESSAGGFISGPTQKQRAEDIYEGDNKLVANSDNTNTMSVAAIAPSVAMALPQLSQVPDFKEGSIIAATLGREHQCRVIGMERHVEAYRLAGAAGLWGKAVPGLLFVAENDKVCALGMVAGVPMPLEPQEWTGNDLQQAKESVWLLHQSNITLTDMKPANFVKLSGSGMNGNILETATWVVAIDLECFSRMLAMSSYRVGFCEKAHHVASRSIDVRTIVSARTSYPVRTAAIPCVAAPIACLNVGGLDSTNPRRSVECSTAQRTAVPAGGDNERPTDIVIEAQRLAQ
eukprot:scaffold16306_cov45-Attheya_sp.AAC.1